MLPTMGGQTALNLAKSLAEVNTTHQLLELFRVLDQPFTTILNFHAPCQAACPIQLPVPHQQSRLVPLLRVSSPDCHLARRTGSWTSTVWS